MKLLWLEDETTDPFSFNNTIAKIVRILKDVGFGEEESAETINCAEHSFFVPKSFKEAYTAVNNCIDHYDLILIDLNLEKYDDISEMRNIYYKGLIDLSDENFQKTAGYILYLDILFRGFSLNRIMFLSCNIDKKSYIGQLGIKDIDGIIEIVSTIIVKNTIHSPIEIQGKSEALRKRLILFDSKYTDTLLTCAKAEYLTDNKTKFQMTRDLLTGSVNRLLEDGNNIKNTLDEMGRLCKNARMQMPESCPKFKTDEFKKWLIRKINVNSEYDSEYVRVRRTIFSGIYEINLLLKRCYNDKTLSRKQINDAFWDKDHYDEEGNDLSAYLNRMKIFFPFLMHDRNDIYPQLIRDIAHEFNNSKGFVVVSDENDLVADTCNSFMRYFRNITSHGGLSDETIRDKLVSLVFIIAVRAIIRFNANELMGYENKLFSIINNYPETKPNHVWKQQINESFKHLMAIRELLLTEECIEWQQTNISEKKDDLKKRGKENQTPSPLGQMIKDTFWFDDKMIIVPGKKPFKRFKQKNMALSIFQEIAFSILIQKFIADFQRNQTTDDSVFIKIFADHTYFYAFNAYSEKIDSIKRRLTKY